MWFETGNFIEDVSKRYYQLDNTTVKAMIKNIINYATNGDMSVEFATRFILDMVPYISQEEVEHFMHEA